MCLKWKLGQSQIKTQWMIMAGTAMLPDASNLAYVADLDDLRTEGASNATGTPKQL
jgi:hypothetical protein